MPAPWIFIRWRSRLFRRVVAQRFLRRRHLVRPFFVGHLVRFRFGRRHARRIRRVRACVHVAFFRRQLTTRPIGGAPHDPVKRLALACRSIATLPQCQSLNIKGLNIRAWLSQNSSNVQSAGDPMKRSRRVILTMMGTAAVGAVSMGFVPRVDCGPGRVPYRTRGPDGRLIESCPATYGGFGGGLHRFHGHGHGHGHGGG
jgi:hypothetical protein